MSRALRAAALLLLLAGPAAADTPSGKPILPGWWSYRASTVLSAESDGRQCVRPDKIDEFLSGPHNKHYTCTYPSRSVADGAARFSGVCVDKHGQSFKITVAGTYSDKRFELKGHISGRFVIPLTLPISIEAEWIGPDCPPGAK